MLDNWAIVEIDAIIIAAVILKKVINSEAWYRTAKDLEGFFRLRMQTKEGNLVARGNEYTFLIEFVSPAEPDELSLTER